MRVERYIHIQAVKIDNEFIPLWDERLQYKADDEDDDFGFLSYRYNNQHYTETVPCLYDIVTKKTISGIVLRNDIESKYKICDEILYEVSHHVLEAVVINDIQYIECHIYTYTAQKLIEMYGVNKLKTLFNINIDDIKIASIYAVHEYKPTYYLSNGVVTDCDYKFFNKKPN